MDTNLRHRLKYTRSYLISDSESLSFRLMRKQNITSLLPEIPSPALPSGVVHWFQVAGEVPLSGSGSHSLVHPGTAQMPHIPAHSLARSEV